MNKIVEIGVGIVIGMFISILLFVFSFMSIGHWTNKDLVDRNLAYYSTTNGAIILKDLRCTF